MLKSPLHRFIVLLLVAAVAGEAVLVVLPHDHTHLAFVSTQNCENPDCVDPSSSHAGPDATVPPNSPCLACILHGLTLSINPEPSTATPTEASQPLDASISTADLAPKSWHHSVRGPPVSV